MKDKIIEIVHDYTDSFPDFEQTAVEEMSEKIMLVMMQAIAGALNKAMGFDGE